MSSAPINASPACIELCNAVWSLLWFVLVTAHLDLDIADHALECSATVCCDYHVCMDGRSLCAIICLHHVHVMHRAARVPIITLGRVPGLGNTRMSCCDLIY